MKLGQRKDNDNSIKKGMHSTIMRRLWEDEKWGGRWEISNTWDFILVYHNGWPTTE